VLTPNQEPRKVSTLDNLDGVFAFDQKKRLLVQEYAGYSLNERLEKTLFIIGNIFYYRKEMIQKISNLKRIPQFQNIDNRTANLLIVKIIGKDLLLFALMAVSLFVNPLRILSLFYYVKNGNFSNNINPSILFDRFQSYAQIKSDADRRVGAHFKAVSASIKSDLLMILKIAILFIFPLRLFQLTKLYLNIRLKIRRKRSREDNVFCDKEFETKMHEYINTILEELKKDGSSAFAIMIILGGVFEVKSTWKRVKTLVVHQAKQTEIYSYANSVWRRSFVEHLEVVGILKVLIKLRLYKKP